MAIKIDIPFRKSFVAPIDREKAYQYLADLPRSIPTNFPGVERFEAVAGGAYRWTFEAISYGGHNLAFALQTRFTFSPPDRIVAVPDGSGSRLDAMWTLVERGPASTEVSFDAKIELELPLPFFLKGMATPLAQKEITKLFERYIGRVSTNIQG